MEVTQSVIVNRKLCSAEFHLAPSPSPVHTARGASLGVSIREFVGRHWILNALHFLVASKAWTLCTLRA